MVERAHQSVRWMLWALPVWALMLLLGVATKQPDPQSEFGEFARYVTTDRFLLSHLINSILGAAIGAVGFVALLIHLLPSKASGRALAGATSFLAGNTLTAAVFGAAAFAQPALGRAFLENNGDASALYNDVYGVPLFATAMLGMLLFIVGGVIAGVAVSASAKFPRWLGWILAASIPLFAMGSIMSAPLAQAGAAGALVASLGIAWYGRTDDVQA